MKRRLFKTFVALLAIAAAATGPARGQNANPDVTLDFTTNDWGLPTSNTTTTESYTDGTYSITLSAPYAYKFTSGYLLLGKSGAYLELPEFESAVDSIEVVGNSAASGSVKQNIYVGGTAVSTQTTGAKGTNTYVINENYRAAGNIYTLKVENAYNTQITYIKVYYVSSGGGSTPEPPAPAVPHTVRMAAGTVEAANWTLASGNASVTGDQVLEDVMSGSELTATYNGTQKVKSVKAVKYVPPVLVQSIVLDKQTASLGKDSTMTLSVASVLPENAADKSYTWSSDNTSVAIVNATTGVVTGMAAGTANIIATANDGSGVADTCVVTVLRSAILDGVRVLYASDYGLETWSTVVGYNPGVMYQDGDYVKLTSNGAFLCHDGHPVDAGDYSYPPFNDYQWLLVTNISGSDLYYHQGETWQEAIDANRLDNNMWSIEGGQVKFIDLTLVDSNYQPVDPTATIDPSTVNYHLWTLDN